MSLTDKPQRFILPFSGEVTADKAANAQGKAPTKSKLAHVPTSALIWFAAMCLFMVPMTTLIDTPIARWFAANSLPREMATTIELTRVFSHGSGIVLILVGVFLIAPHLRWQLPRLAALTLGASAIATLVKMFVLRPRPSGIDLGVGHYESAWLWAFDWNLSQVTAYDASTRAFPSGNMATAIALTVGLWAILPRGRWLFFLICAGTTLQGLACGAHFPSDIVGGIGCGLLWAYICMHPKLLGSLFDKMQPEGDRPRRSASDPAESGDELTVYSDVA